MSDGEGGEGVAGENGSGARLIPGSDFGDLFLIGVETRVADEKDRSDAGAYGEPSSEVATAVLDEVMEDGEGEGDRTE